MYIHVLVLMGPPGPLRGLRRRKTSRVSGKCRARTQVVVYEVGA